MAELPRIALFTCGGTIVSSGGDALQMTGYSLGGFSADDLLRSVPHLADIARIELHEAARIDSMSMTSEVWRNLAAGIRDALADPGVKGVVVTHGTDTMEETAWFTELVTDSEKPVVFTGAMRPATALCAEGPLNLLNAVRVALDPGARGRGALIAMNDVILTSRCAMKTNPTNVSAFTGVNAGPAGLIAGDAIVWLAPANRTPARFSLRKFSEAVASGRLPRADILYSHADDDGMLVRAAVAAGAKCIVHAGMGNGSIHERTDAALAEAAAAGVIVIRASRAPEGVVTPGIPEWQARGYVPAGTLSPQKARILALLTLLEHGSSVERMREAFAKA